MTNPIKIGVFGASGRARGLLKYAMIPACSNFHVEIAAIYDPYADRTAQCADLVEEATGKRPLEATSEDALLAMEELSAVVICSAWESHLHLAIKAMKAGKHVATEVGGAYCVEDCWELVRTSEETGKHCMLLENCCYGQRELMVLNMVRSGFMGSVVHCAGGYEHDLRAEIAYGKKNRHYRLRNYLNRNCENYPTHELGPIAKLLDINNGNRMVSLTATASCARGMHEYVVENFGAEHPLSQAEFAQGDVITTVIKCAKGQTITLTLDTTLPRAYSRNFTIRGTKASYFEDMDCIFEDKAHAQYEGSPRPIWGNAKEYVDAYQHPIWQNYDPSKYGHEGMDYLVASAFFEFLQKGTRPPIDVYDTAAYMCITALSEESILKGSAPVMIPDFTRGKWYLRNDIDFDLKYNLDRKGVFEDLYE